MSTLEVKISREVTEDEVESMIFGTGGLAYPWWGERRHRGRGLALPPRWRTF